MSYEKIQKLSKLFEKKAFQLELTPHQKSLINAINLFMINEYPGRYSYSQNDKGGLDFYVTLLAGDADKDAVKAKFDAAIKAHPVLSDANSTVTVTEFQAPTVQHTK